MFFKNRLIQVKGSEWWFWSLSAQIKSTLIFYFSTPTEKINWYPSANTRELPKYIISKRADVANQPEASRKQLGNPPSIKQWNKSTPIDMKNNHQEF